MLSQVFPRRSPDSSITIQNHIYQDLPEKGPARDAIDEAIERFKYVAKEEDYKGGRQIQLGMNTEANSSFTIGMNEVGPQNFHTVLDYFLQEPFKDRKF